VNPKRDSCCKRPMVAETRVVDVLHAVACGKRAMAVDREWKRADRRREAGPNSREKP
jgi:hypothetical protein